VIIAAKDYMLLTPASKRFSKFMQKERSEEEIRMHFGDGLKGYGHG